MTALVVLRNKAIKPLLAAAQPLHPTRATHNPKPCFALDFDEQKRSGLADPAHDVLAAKFLQIISGLAGIAVRSWWLWSL
jgi:hypothetical protein